LSLTTGPQARESVLAYLRATRNWGRWGDDDEYGAPNLITPEKIVQASRTVRDGKCISLGRDVPAKPSAANRHPAQHVVMDRLARGTGGTVLDYLGIACHGITSTHIDALCHVWDVDGMWGARRAEDHIRYDGVRWAGIHNWRDGLLTRGVLFDIPAYRGVEFVDIDAPVTGAELHAMAKSKNLSVEPGDALVIYSGREKWSQRYGEYGSANAEHSSGLTSTTDPRPGLHVSCLEYLRDTDCAVLAWDMVDLKPNPDNLAWAVHAAIWAFGIALIDNALIEPLADYCAAHDRADFMLSVAPLRIVGGTGSPVNPIAIL
jgi:kynurenine formamidase